MKKENHRYRGDYRLPRTVCRRVAASRNDRGNTRTARNTRRDHSAADTSGAGRTNIARNHRKARIGNAGS